MRQWHDDTQVCTWTERSIRLQDTRFLLMCSETLEAEHAKSYFQQRLKDARRLGTGLFLTETRLNVCVRSCLLCLKDTWPSMNSGSIEVSFLINSQPLGSYFCWRRPQGPTFFPCNKSPRPPFCGLAIGSTWSWLATQREEVGYVHALHFPCTSSRCLTFWTWEVCLRTTRCFSKRGCSTSGHQVCW